MALRIKRDARVGVICDDDIVYGTVVDLMPQRTILILSDDHYLKQFESKRVFPVWNGNYTFKEAGQLADSLLADGEGRYAELIAGLDYLTGHKIMTVVRDLGALKIHQVSYKTTNLIMDFLDWAKHGFPVKEV